MSKNVERKLKEEQYRMATELTEYQKNPNIQLTPETLIVTANSHDFKINPKGHLLDTKTKIREIQDKYKTDLIKAIEEHDVLKETDIYEKASKDLILLCLVDFDYNTWANHIDIGPTVIGQITTEVAHFLVVRGGKAGWKHWEMQQKLGTLTLSNLSNTSKD